MATLKRKKPRSRPGAVTPEKIVAALNEVGGHVYLAADLLGCGARTIYRHAEKDDSVREAIDHHKGKRLDTAEGKLWEAVLAGAAWAVCFYLKTQGKARGYVEKQEVETTVASRLVIEEEVVGGDDNPKGPAPQGAG